MPLIRRAAKQVLAAWTPLTTHAAQSFRHYSESERIYGGLGRTVEREKLEQDPTYKQAPKDMSSILDDSASALFTTEIFRGMAYTIKAFFDPKVTVSLVFRSLQ